MAIELYRAPYCEDKISREIIGNVLKDGAGSVILEEIKELRKERDELKAIVEEHYDDD